VCEESLSQRRDLISGLQGFLNSLRLHTYDPWEAFSCLSSLTSGYDNTAIGVLALNLCQTGYGNVAIGQSALQKCTTNTNVKIN
jgi:hypothetical protein